MKHGSYALLGLVLAVVCGAGARAQEEMNANPPEREAPKRLQVKRSEPPRPRMEDGRQAELTIVARPGRPILVYDSAGNVSEMDLAGYETINKADPEAARRQWELVKQAMREARERREAEEAAMAADEEVETVPAADAEATENTSGDSGADDDAGSAAAGAME